jgi:N-acetylglucosaminyldiphosphoundecaprenol N-acetyl-beta-D-mannosaminyltransferase
LLQDPKRLWHRYLRNNPAFIWRVFVHFLCSRVWPKRLRD